MKKQIQVISVIALLILSVSNTFAQDTKHVILISIDGFRSDFYLENKWGTPNIKMLAEQGVYAEEVRTIFPSVTYPSHTTLTTGVFPEKHGIYYNTKVDDRGSSSGWVYDFGEIKSKTIWEAAKEKGLSTASVSWPVTVNNPFIDYNIPEFWSFKNPSDRRSATSEYSNPKGLFEEVVANATGNLEINEFNLTTLQMDQNLGRISTYIIEKYKPNLLTIHLPNTDGAQHATGRNNLEVKRAIAAADNVVGQIYDAVKRAGIMENTAIIITGDHGFVDVHTSISPNLWLVENGLSDEAVFFSVGGAAFLHVKKGKAQEVIKKVRSVLRNLPDSQKNLFKIIDENQLREIQSDPRVSLAISANEGFFFDNSIQGNLLKDKVGGKHGYFPDFFNIYTGFVGYGGAFKKSGYVKYMTLEDIAPIISYLLKIDLDDVSGNVYPGMFSNN